jgi:hypothetical protein
MEDSFSNISLQCGPGNQVYLQAQKGGQILLKIHEFEDVRRLGKFNQKIDIENR